MFRNAACASFARASVAAVLGTTAILLWPSALYAAEQTKSDTKTEDEELTEVRVTGTRIQSPNVTSGNPVTSITGEEMRRLGIVNVADVLTQLVPQNISTYTPTMVGDSMNSLNDDPNNPSSGNMRGTYFIGATIANLRGLDPQFGSRTLTLIDGRRVGSTSNQADVVDLNIIPSNLLERVDVVTGGASATYGSGAMAGVVNMVLNRRLNGFNLDMDYGVNEAGDGGSPHVALSGGTDLLGGKGHALFGVEWQKQEGIRDCAAARPWCAESRALYLNTSNSTGTAANLLTAAVPIPGFEGYPSRFEQDNVRLSQFSPSGVIAYNNTAFTSGYKFTADGTDVLEDAFGFQGGGSNRNTANGDGPLATTGQTLTSGNTRKSFFTNFEYDLSPTTTVYLQARYATTYAENKNRYTRGDYCVRFDTTGTPFVTGGHAAPSYMTISGTTSAIWQYPDASHPGDNHSINQYLEYIKPSNPANDATKGTQMAQSVITGTTGFPTKDTLFNNANFRTFIGWSGPTPLATPGDAPPYWVNPGAVLTGGTLPDTVNRFGTTPGGNTPPNLTFANATPIWVHVYRTANNTTTNERWLLLALVLTGPFDDPGSPAVLPQLGRNAYAFLGQLTPTALAVVQNSASGGSGVYVGLADAKGQQISGASTAPGAQASGAALLWGNTPCAGYTAIRKVWTPQIQQWTTNGSDTWSATAGMRGRFASDWRWEASFQAGGNDSTSKANNVLTNISSAFAMDSVVDDRRFLADGITVNPTYGQPVCRVTRDGMPALDWQGEPLSQAADLQSIANGCKPLNIFGTTFGAFNSSVAGTTMTPAQAAELQQEALNYAFKNTESRGGSDNQSLSLTTNGTLWQGWAGPLTGAFGLDLNQNTLDNTGSQGPYYLKADIASQWGDAFGGRTRVAEGYTEFNMPLVTGQDGINLLSIDAALRWGFYNNKGGAGTTGQSNTQDTPNWKFQAEFSPFDWVRFRVSRSEDLRAAGYRELFNNQSTAPDSVRGQNPWRERSGSSTENQFERYGTISVGNPDLKPERSNTLTLGLVLRPGGWAQGMSMSADYYNIRVRDGVAVAFGQSQPLTACWNNSTDANGNHNVAPTIIDGTIDVEHPGTNGIIDFSLPECQAITFAKLKDENGKDIDGSHDLTDVISYNTGKPTNGLPFQRRGLDLNWSYNFPLSRAFETLPGSISLSLRGTRALESTGASNVATTVCDNGSVYSALTLACSVLTNGVSVTHVVNVVQPSINYVGQIRTPGNVYIAGIQPTPKWIGNFNVGYLYGNLTTTLAGRYVGGAKLDKTWVDDPDLPAYWATDAAGNFLLDSTGNRQLSNASVDNNTMKPYLDFTLSGSYNLKVAHLKQFQVFGAINNLFDKTPPFLGGGISGANAQYNDTLGRAYRMGVRLKF